MKKSLRKLLPLLVAASFGTAYAATEADVENTFNPYKAGMPSFAGLKAGMTINKGNVDQFKDILGAGVFKLIKEGMFEMKVGPTTQFSISKAYIDAMVKGHTEALAVLDNKLIPKATTQAVKDHLAATREHVAHHLERAESLAR